MTLVLLVPAVLAQWLIGAHFLRYGHLLPTAICLALPGLLLIPRRWAAIATQVILLLGAAEWIRTTVGIARDRIAAGEPWTRMAVILSAVTLFTIGAALLFQTRRLRRRYAGVSRRGRAS